MSFLDKAKQAIGQAKDRAGHLAGQHADKIEQAIDKGGSYLDKRTGGKYSDKIEKAGDSAKSAASNLADQHHEAEQPRSSTKAPEAPAAPTYDPPQPVDPTEPVDGPNPLAPDANRNDSDPH
jgi:uncharacterized protein YjbJ (UPF0337 family)